VGTCGGHYCCLTSFFPIVDTCLSCEDIARQSCAMVLRWRFWRLFASCVSASCVQQVSDLHFKFALRSHHVWKLADIQSAAAEIRRGKTKKTERKNTRHDENIMVCRSKEHQNTPFSFSKLNNSSLLSGRWTPLAPALRERHL